MDHNCRKRGRPRKITTDVEPSAHNADRGTVGVSSSAGPPETPKSTLSPGRSLPTVSSTPQTATPDRISSCDLLDCTPRKRGRPPIETIAVGGPTASNSFIPHVVSSGDVAQHDTVTPLATGLPRPDINPLGVVQPARISHKRGRPKKDPTPLNLQLGSVNPGTVDTFEPHTKRGGRISEPWKGKMVLTDDGVVEIDGEKLHCKVESVQGMLLSGKIDVQDVFDRILEIAVEKKLSEEQMVKRVFVFTEMEAGQLKEEEYAEIHRKFLDKGYNKVPEIVFWNVKNAAGMRTDVKCDNPVSLLLAGFPRIC